MIVGFNDDNGTLRIGYITSERDGLVHICTKPGTYFHVKPEQVIYPEN